MAPPGEMPRCLGDFELIRQIGRGGMGVVYEARQKSLNRRVALKVLDGGIGLSQRAVLRFRREAEAAAGLHHTNIVPVYAIGEESGQHFYAMERIDGLSLDRVLEQWRDAQGQCPPVVAGSDPGRESTEPPDPEVTAAYEPTANRAVAPAPSGSRSGSTGSGTGSDHFDRVARMLAEVAEALDYAHRNGIVHRDVKPSNLLLSPDGRLSLNDFGLARVLEEPGVTLTGEIVGTPRYMSPEQLAAGRVPLDHRTDIYSLGATLYEMITLRPPFDGARREQVLSQILHKDPPPPRRLNKRVPIDLETICVKAMEKDPDRRYQTAGQMAEDLRRFAGRREISARRTGPVGRMVRWARRRPGLATAIGAAAIAMAAAAALGLEAHRTRQRLLAERSQAALEKAILIALSGDFDETDRAIAQAEALGASTGEVRMLRGQVALYRGDHVLAARELEQAARLLPDRVAPQAMLATAYLWLGQNERSLRILEALGHQPARGPEDYLFLAQAQSYFDSKAALATLEMASGLRGLAPAVRLTRAEIRSNLALQTEDPADVARALEDLSAAKAAMLDGPSVHTQELLAHLAEARVLARLGRVDEERRALDQVRAAADSLGRFPESPLAATFRNWYLDFAGRHEEAIDGWIRGFGRWPSHGQFANSASIAHFRRGDPSKGEAVLDRFRALGGDSVVCESNRPILLLDRSGSVEAALAAARGVADRYRAEGGPFQLMNFLLLIGRRSQAIELARLGMLGDGGTATLSEFNSQNELFLAVLTGKISEDEYAHLARKLPGDELLIRSALFRIRLSEGDRVGALEHLRQAVKTRLVMYGVYDWTQAFVERMERDPTWPPWIPVAKPAPGGPAARD
ncbi:MAG: protein kinase [Isosphaeraceae bacterium]